ncbi:MAG: hypothetical protein AB7K04_02180 [Pseudorhodoplanes sp.]
MNFIRRGLGIEAIRNVSLALKREALALSHSQRTSGIHIKYDAVTPRLSLLRKTCRPFIAPQGEGWMSGAVYDARPVRFNDRTFYYFCGQPAYRTDYYLFVGLAQSHGGVLSVRKQPVIVPDIEKRGVDIPAFTVHRGAVVGIYADNFGPARDRRGLNADLVLLTSQDGETFTKRIISKPFANSGYKQIGLPWLLADGDRLRLYLRAKVKGAVLLLTTDIDFDAATIGPLSVAARFRRNPINVAVTKRRGTYILFSGATVGGGAYAAPSRDGNSFDFDREVMLTGDFEWGWDYYKIACCPDNTTEDEVDLCYTTGKGPSIGHATFDAAALIEYWKGAKTASAPSPFRPQDRKNRCGVS